MKATDLMIGDWIMADRVPAQILSLGSKGATITGGLDKACHYDNMQPITLTPEILEKNWFLVGYKKGSRTYYHIGWDFYLDLDGGEILLQIRRDCDFTFFGIISCKYVHELQQALKLCGIEKKVIL